jgi:hypothetical protein
MTPVSLRILWATLLTLLCYAAGFLSLYVQVNPFSGLGEPLVFLGSATGFACGLAAFLVAGANPPRGFALVGIGLAAFAGALAGVVRYYA